jgi:hypothetical protein
MVFLFYRLVKGKEKLYIQISISGLLLILLFFNIFYLNLVIRAVLSVLLTWSQLTRREILTRPSKYSKVLLLIIVLKYF